MARILALDQGTTSSRAIVFDQELAILGIAQREFEQRYPRPGWVEHDALEIRDSQLEVARAALDHAGVAPSEVSAIGITNQRETTVLWDRRTGEPVAPAIVWQDRRTAGFCERLRDGDRADEIRHRTGLQIDPYFSATKLRWLLRHVVGARERAERGELAFGTIDAWLIWCLTGGERHATDASNASRTLLFDLERGDWSRELLDLFEVPAGLLPEVVDSSGEIARTDPSVMGAAIPIAGVAGDQQAALFGQMCVKPGMAKNTYGTGCFLLMNTGAEPVVSERGLLSTVAWRRNGSTTYALEGSVFVGGAAVQWLRDELGLIETAADVEPLAASVPDAQGVWFVPAFTGLGAPHWDPRARGTLLGLTRGSGAGNIARATLDGIAHQVADVVEAMREDAGLELEEMRVDGGAAANELLLRIQADLLGVPVVRPANLETTALGAACLAGLGVGVWDDLDELATRWTVSRRVRPEMAGAEARALRNRWALALERATAWEQDEATE